MTNAKIAIELLKIKNKTYKSNKELVKDYLEMLEELEKRLIK